MLSAIRRALDSESSTPVILGTFYLLVLVGGSFVLVSGWDSTTGVLVAVPVVIVAGYRLVLLGRDLVSAHANRAAVEQ